MNQGVETLLARMDSNPEEFAFQFDGNWPRHPQQDRWLPVMDAVVRRVARKAGEEVSGGPSKTGDLVSFLTDEEVQALYDKYLSLQGDAFTRFVMRTLLVEEQGGNTERPTTAKGPPRIGARLIKS